MLMQDMTQDETSTAWDADHLSAAHIVLQQLPWEVVSELQQDSIKTDICTPIFHFLGNLARQAALPGQQAKDLAQTLMKVKAVPWSFPVACAELSNLCLMLICAVRYFPTLDR